MDRIGRCGLIEHVRPWDGCLRYGSFDWPWCIGGRRLRHMGDVLDVLFVVARDVSGLHSSLEFELVLAEDGSLD